MLCLFLLYSKMIQLYGVYAFVYCSVMSDSLQPNELYLPVSSVQGIFQARILEWVAISFSRGSSQTRDLLWILYHWDTGQFLILPDPEIELASLSPPVLKVGSLPVSHWGSLCVCICVCVYIFHSLFHYGFSQDIEYSSLWCAVGPCSLFILYEILIAPNPSLPTSLCPWQHGR